MMQTPGGFVDTERVGDTIVLWLNAPGTLNRFSTEAQFLELAEAIRQAGRDATACALVISGRGKAFCAGGDLQRMSRREGFSAGTLQEVRQRYQRSIHQVPLALNEVDIPTIAAVNGAAYGAGCDLACLCDIRIASESAAFCVSFAQIGIVSGDGGAWMLPRLIGRSRAMEMTFTAEPVDSAEALRIGLVSQRVAPEQLMARALALAEKIGRHPRDPVRMSKRLLRSAERLSLEDHLDMVAVFQAIAHASDEHIAAVDTLLGQLQRKGG